MPRITPRITPRAGVAFCVVTIALLVAGVVLLGGDDGGDRVATGTTTSAVTASTTSTTSVAATTAPPAPTTPPETVIAGPVTAPATTVPGAPDASQLKLDLRGLGPVRVGMTVPQAQTALGRNLRSLGEAAGPCVVYAPEGGPDGVAFMVTKGKVARVDVIGGAVTTGEGLAIGLTESEAQQRYGNTLRVSAHDYVDGGHYLTLVPTAPADAGFRLVAETDGAKVTAFRAGKLPEVEFSEGCS